MKDDDKCNIGIINFDGKLLGDGSFKKIENKEIDPESLIYLDDRNQYLSKRKDQDSLILWSPDFSV